MEQRKFKVGDKVKVKVKVNDRNSFKPAVWIGEIIYINDKLMVPYLVGIKGFNGHSGNGLGGEKIAKQKGYDNQCWWCDESGLELLEEKKMTGNEIIDLLMKKLGVEIDEEFEIIESIYNPYKITEKGYLIDCDGDERTDILVNLILGERTIKKIPKPEIKEMTVSELEEALKLPKGTLRVKGED